MIITHAELIATKAKSTVWKGRVHRHTARVSTRESFHRARDNIIHYRNESLVLYTVESADPESPQSKKLEKRAHSDISMTRCASGTWRLAASMRSFVRGCVRRNDGFFSARICLSM